MSPIKVLVVGSGHGCRVHVPALNFSQFEVVGLVGTNPEKTQRRAERVGVARGFTDLAKAIHETGAQAVTVASTPHSHYEMVKTALLHQCHVLCEKPFTLNAAQAKELLTLARQVGVVHMLGNQLRAQPERIIAARAIGSGAIGVPKFITLIQYTGLLADTSQPWPAWWFDANLGGGWLGASGSHMIDHVRSWLGDFESVSAALPVVADRTNVTEDSFCIRFRLVNGVEGIMQQCAAGWGDNAAMTRVTGTQGSLWIENNSAWVADKNGTRELTIPAELELPEQPVSDDPRERFLHFELPPARKMFSAWQRAINGAEDTTFATFADGYATMQVMDAIRESAANNGRLAAVK